MVEIIQQEKLNEKFLDKITDVDIITRPVEMYADWETQRQFYETSLVYGVEALDEAYMTFAAIYDHDLNHVLSKRNPSFENAPFEPMGYSRFREAVSATLENPEHSDGQTTLYFEDKAHGVEGRDMLVYWRWTPDDVSEQYLVVVGISKYSVASEITVEVEWIVGGMAVITSVLNFVLVWAVVGLGTRHRHKGGASDVDHIV